MPGRLCWVEVDPKYLSKPLASVKSVQKFHDKLLSTSLLGYEKLSSHLLPNSLNLNPLLHAAHIKSNTTQLHITRECVPTQAHGAPLECN